MNTDWSARVPDDVAHRRAGGRRGYNARRQFMATWRRVRIARLLRKGLRQAVIARLLGVHPSTISRDVKRLFEEGRIKHCPHCGKPLGAAEILYGEYYRVLEVLDREDMAGGIGLGDPRASGRPVAADPG